MELIILKQELPKIDVNFEEVKEQLQIKLDDYKDLIVTEENLKDSKKDQKELSALITKVDEYRKKVKAELSVPITTFENKCKEIITLIDDTQKPIKEGIEVFNDKIRASKKQYAEKEIERVCKELLLNEEYSKKVILKPNFKNISITKKEVSNDIYNQVELLVKEQEQYKTNMELINNACKKASYTINTKTYFDKLDRKSITNILNLIESDIKAFDDAVVKAKEEAKIEAKAKIEAELEEAKVKAKNKEFQERVRLDELKLEEEFMIKELKEWKESKENVVEVKKEVIVDEVSISNKRMTYTLKVTGTKESLKKLRKTIEELGIEYEIKEGEVQIK